MVDLQLDAQMVLKELELYGKLRKRMWVNINAIVLVDVWKFQDEKCSILHVYDETEVENLLESREI